MLNDVAKSVIESQRGKHKTHVFTYRGKPVTRIYNSGWKTARVRAAERYAEDRKKPAYWGFANVRVHDLGPSSQDRVRSAILPRVSLFMFPSPGEHLSCLLKQRNARLPYRKYGWSPWHGHARTACTRVVPIILQAERLPTGEGIRGKSSRRLSGRPF